MHINNVEDYIGYALHLRKKLPDLYDKSRRECNEFIMSEKRQIRLLRLFDKISDENANNIEKFLERFITNFD